MTLSKLLMKGWDDSRKGWGDICFCLINKHLEIHDFVFIVNCV